MKKSSIIIPHHGREVRGTFYEPEWAQSFPLVIFSHGFNGSGEHFTRHAHLLAENGIGAVTFDFCGGSVTYRGDMRSTDMTVFTEKEDLEAVAGYVRELEQVDQERIFLFGASQGGFVTAIAASEHSEFAKGILLLYPALCIADDWDRAFPNLSDIPDTQELWGVTLGRKYFEAVHGLKIYEKIGGYQGPVLVMHGEDDPVVSVDYSRRLSEVCHDFRLEVFAGEGHGFTEAGDARVAQLTLDFVRERA